MGPEDYIYIDSWERLVADLGGALVYRKTEDVTSFFDEVRGTGRKVILVSGCCDYGLHLQGDAHPNEDLMKLAASVSWSNLGGLRDAYHQVQIGPACVPDKCDASHRYSLKTDRFTWATFNDIPDEVGRWYTTNLNCAHPRVELIPFGLNTDGDGSSLLTKYVGRPKTGLLYVNFQNNSLERVQLKQFFARLAQEGEVTFRPEANLPIEQCLEEMASHKFVLAPPGNGLDCYRIWEALYLGCIPILTESVFSHALAGLGLPVAVVQNPYALDANSLESWWDEVQGEGAAFYSLEAATLSYWRNRMCPKDILTS